MIKKKHLKTGGFIKIWMGGVSIISGSNMERRVPFLLVKFHYIIAEIESFYNKTHFV